MLQEGEDSFQKTFHVNESKIFSRKSAREECSQFVGRRENNLVIDHRHNRLAIR